MSAKVLPTKYNTLQYYKILQKLGLQSMYSWLSRSNTARGSCTGLVTVGPTKVTLRVDFDQIGPSAGSNPRLVKNDKRRKRPRCQLCHRNSILTSILLSESEYLYDIAVLTDPKTVFLCTNCMT